MQLAYGSPPLWWRLFDNLSRFRFAAKEGDRVFVDLAAMTHGEHSEDSARSIRLVHDAEASHLEFPETLELPSQRHADVGIGTESPDGLLHAALQVRW